LNGENQLSWNLFVKSACYRHFGIGADGVIVIQKSNIADLKMRIFNADGSEAEACGNGLRCFTKYTLEKVVQNRKSVDRSVNLELRSNTVKSLSIETIAGIRQARAFLTDSEVNKVEVSMGKPQFDLENIPVSISGDQVSRIRYNEFVANGDVRLINYPLSILNRELQLYVLSMGNPHAVLFQLDDVNNYPLSEIGPKVEYNKLFPKRTNFEVVRITDKKEIDARVWERGVGETLACGSGACAIAVAAQILGYCSNVIDIKLPGGKLTIRWDGSQEVYLMGPVEEVFTGEY
jgi:diaminopimelate epimerase